MVLIDPISFSILKKVQLRFQDYEIPKHIKESIKHLQTVFDHIKTKMGKDIIEVF